MILAKYGKGEILNENQILLKSVNKYGTLVLKDNFKAFVIPEKFIEEVYQKDGISGINISILKSNLIMKINHAAIIEDKLKKLDEKIRLKIQKDFDKKYGLQETNVAKEMKEAEYNSKLDIFNKIVGRKEETGGTKITKDLIGLVTPKLTSKNKNFNTLNLKQQKSLMTLKGIASKAKFGDEKVVQNMNQKKRDLLHINKLAMRNDIGLRKISQNKNNSDKGKASGNPLKKFSVNSNSDLLSKLTKKTQAPIVKSGLKQMGIGGLLGKSSGSGLNKDKHKKKMDEFGILKPKKKARKGRLAGLPI